MRNFLKRITLALEVLQGRKTEKSIYDKGVNSVLKDYQQVRDKLYPLLEKIIEKGFLNSNGISNSDSSLGLHRVDFHPFANAESLLSVREFPPLDSCTYNTYSHDRIYCELVFNSRLTHMLEQSLRESAKVLANKLLSEGFIKYELMRSPVNDSMLRMVCWINVFK